MATIFENPGIIDPRCITTAGVNVKDESRPTIGFFGTGLKIAIAVLLRNGQNITIHAGTQIHTFTYKPVEIRGKSFQLICMNGQELGFTTEYGKTWELWMAYRELWSNCMDEGGRVYVSDDLADVQGCTQIVVDGMEFDEVHATRDQFLIGEREPRIKLPEVEIYNGGSEYVFYQGIRAGKVPCGNKSKYTYNILESMVLTEDRTLAHGWQVQSVLARMVLESKDKGFVFGCLSEADEQCMEAQLDYEQTYTTASDEFVEMVQKMTKTHAGKINKKALSKFARQTAKSIAPQGRQATAREQEIIDRAREFAASIGFPNDKIEWRVSEELSEGTLALAIMGEGVSILSTKLFAGGWQHVAQAVIEESVHIKKGLPDCGRVMQTFLFEEIVRLGKQLVGND